MAKLKVFSSTLKRNIDFSTPIYEISRKVFLFYLNVENVFECIYLILYFIWSVYLRAVFL